MAVLGEWEVRVGAPAGNKTLSGGAGGGGGGGCGGGVLAYGCADAGAAGVGCCCCPGNHSIGDVEAMRQLRCFTLYAQLHPRPASRVLSPLEMRHSISMCGCRPDVWLLSLQKNRSSLLYHL
ncbi:unnamed protein product [Toxocara canis]|uniref:Uncharacterized protein n=1 Tax=Toxocara canis TaxID=6265 RepID=A0A183UV19_TOXCA|nr:unnamed protein product [Toxocara canis]